MACRAAIASFAIHAALVIMVGWRWFPSAPHVGSGDPGADGTFSNGGADGFLVEAVPNHAPDPAVVALPPAERQLFLKEILDADEIATNLQSAARRE